MNHGSGLGSSSPAGHLERVDDDLGSDPIGDRPADDTTAECVDDRSAVDPAVVRAMLRDVAEPESVRLGCAELSLHEIIVRCCVGFPTAPLATVRDAGEAVKAHESGDPLLADVDTEPEPQLGQHSRGAISAPRVAVNLPDRRRQRLVRDRPQRWRTRCPLVVAGLRDVQEPAGHRNRNPVSGELLDQPEPYFWSTFSLAK